MSGPILVVAVLTNPSPEPFAVCSVDPARRHPEGGVVATIVSLHMTRAEADRVVLSGQAPETRQ